jgi:hypothetical protein
MNLLVESERIDSEIFVIVIESLVMEFGTNFWDEFFLGARKDPLGSSTCALGWSLGWISLHFLLPYRGHRVVNVHTIGKECKAAEGDISM